MKTRDRERPARRKQDSLRLRWKIDEAASRLAMGVTKFKEMVASHEFYSADSYVGVDPRWSEDLLELIELALRTTPQKVRVMTDDEGLAARIGEVDFARQRYQQHAEAVQ